MQPAARTLSCTAGQTLPCTRVRSRLRTALWCADWARRGCLRPCCWHGRGYRPIVLERGPALDARVQAVEHFSATGQLDPNANIQFGEGGAGTFSDGKLTTRIGDELCDFVTEVFLQHGAPAEIAWKQKPHVGTDLLRGVITSIRKEIESLGGEVHFNTALTGLERKKRTTCGHHYYKRQLCLRDTGVCSGALGTGYVQHADG